jgi:hypothetical protein
MIGISVLSIHQNSFAAKDVLMHALAPLTKTFFPVVSAFLSVVGHAHTGFLAKAREKPACPRFEKA